MNNSIRSQLIVITIACILALSVFTLYAGYEPEQINSHSVRTTTTAH